MGKEFEILKYVKDKIADLEDDLQHYTMVEKDKCKEFYTREDLKAFKHIEQALTELQQIKEAKPSEALECLEKLPYTSQGYGNWKEYYNTIKQALLKAQEQEKVIEIVFKKNVDVYVLKNSYSMEHYNFKVSEKKPKTPFNEFALTQEEFDLLKRWQND